MGMKFDSVELQIELNVVKP